MKKDVNRVLLYLILIPMFLFAWFAGYYHSTFSEKTCIVDDNSPASAVVLQGSNDTFQKQKEILEEGYFQMRSEKEAMQLEKEKVENDCSSSKAELSSVNNKFSLLQNQFNSVQSSLITANEQISSLIYKNKQLCEKVKSYGEEC